MPEGIVRVTPAGICNEVNMADRASVYEREPLLRIAELRDTAGGIKVNGPSLPSPHQLGGKPVK